MQIQHIITAVTHCLLVVLFMMEGGVSGQSNTQFTTCYPDVFVSVDSDSDGYLGVTELGNFFEVLKPAKCTYDPQTLANDERVWEQLGCYCTNYIQESQLDEFCCSLASLPATTNATLEAEEFVKHAQLAVPDGNIYPEPEYSNKLCSFIDQIVLAECLARQEEIIEPSIFQTEVPMTPMPTEEEEEDTPAPTGVYTPAPTSSPINPSTEPEEDDEEENPLVSEFDEELVELEELENEIKQQEEIADTVVEDLMEEIDEQEEEEEEAYIPEDSVQPALGIISFVMVLLCIIFSGTFLAEGTGAGAKEKHLKQDAEAAAGEDDENSDDAFNAIMNA